MAETKSLAASVRGVVGKGAARSVRREGRIPGVIYGGGEPPTPISLLWHDVNKLIYAGGFMTTTFELDVDGEKQKAIPRDYQLDPVNDRPVHVDFLRLKAGQKITVEIPIHAAGQETCPGLKAGGALNIVRHVVELSVPADAIPEHVEVDISGLAIGDSIHIADLKLPTNTRLATAADGAFAVLTIAAPIVEEEPETPAEPAVAEDSVPAEEQPTEPTGD